MTHSSDTQSESLLTNEWVVTIGNMWPQTFEIEYTTLHIHSIHTQHLKERKRKKRVLGEIHSI